VETDPPAVKQAVGAPGAELEDPLPLLKELALLGEKERKAGEIHQLVVGFDLGEVGVQREIQGQIARDVVFQIGTDLQDHAVLK
jgi:hypothetical protein